MLDKFLEIWDDYIEDIKKNYLVEEKNESEFQ